VRRAVIVTGPGFQDEEFVYPYYRLLEAGFEVDVATKDGEVVYGKYGVPARANRDVHGLLSKDYELVILPGGHEAPDRVRQIKEVLIFVKAMFDEGKIVAALCHGPWITISAGIMNGRKATCYEGMADDLRNAGAEYLAAPVVVDGNLVTSPHYRNNGDFMKAVLQKFDSINSG
jgi:protease I